MQPNNSTTPVHSSPVGCSPIIFVLVMVFAFFTISASITPLNNLIARYTLCPTASAVYFVESSGGIVEKLGVQNDVSGKLVTMHCEYANQASRVIENDVVVATGFAASAGLGAVVGLIAYAGMLFRSRMPAG